MFDVKKYINSDPKFEDLYSNDKTKACLDYLKNYKKEWNFKGFDSIIDFVPTNLNSKSFKVPDLNKNTNFKGSIIDYDFLVKGEIQNFRKKTNDHKVFDSYAWMG